MKSLVVLKYSLIDDYKDTNFNNHLRIPAEIFKNQIFAMIKSGKTPIFLEDFEKVKSGDYFLVTIDGNYEANKQALRFLTELRICTILNCFRNSEMNSLQNGLPTMDKIDIQTLVQANIETLRLGDLPAEAENLVTELNFNKMMDSILERSTYFSYFHDDGYNETIIQLMKTKGYEYAFTNNSDSPIMSIEDLDAKQYQIPRVNCNNYVDISEFTKEVANRKLRTNVIQKLIRRIRPLVIGSH